MQGKVRFACGDMSMFGGYGDPGGEFGLRIHLDRPDGTLEVATTIEMVAHERDDPLPPPVLRLGRQEVQGLIDVLWQAGFKPTHWKYPEGQIEELRIRITELKQARDSHIEDLRKFVECSNSNSDGTAGV